MTIEKFLRGGFDFKFSDENISTVLASRSIEPLAPIETVSGKDRDLARADLYMVLASVISGGGKKVQMGNRSVSERNYSFGVTDRRFFASEANRLYAKWGEAERKSSVKFVRVYGN